MVEKMKEESSKEIYKKRKTIVEPVFGQIKKNMDFGDSVCVVYKGRRRVFPGMRSAQH